jgi:hypothetical protein
MAHLPPLVRQVLKLSEEQSLQACYVLDEHKLLPVGVAATISIRLSASNGRWKEEDVPFSSDDRGFGCLAPVEEGGQSRGFVTVIHGVMVVDN